jgi:hypothetical protein
VEAPELDGWAVDELLDDADEAPEEIVELEPPDWWELEPELAVAEAAAELAELLRLCVSG